MKDDEISREAWRREASHEHHESNRPHLRPVGGNLIGLRGEEAFGKEFKVPVDLTPRPGGDGGRDNPLPVQSQIYTVDCKTALKPKDLIVEVPSEKRRGCQPDTIYVLCRYIEAEDRAELVGWQWGRVLMRSTPKDYGYGVMNYWQPRGEIRPIAELHAARTDAERAGHPNGFVGYDKEDHFVHYCKCGRDAGHGHDVRLAKGEFGTWYCAEHDPK